LCLRERKKKPAAGSQLRRAETHGKGGREKKISLLEEKGKKKDRGNHPPSIRGRLDGKKGKKKYKKKKQLSSITLYLYTTVKRKRRG